MMGCQAVGLMHLCPPRPPPWGVLTPPLLWLDVHPFSPEGTYVPVSRCHVSMGSYMVYTVSCIHDRST